MKVPRTSEFVQPEAQNIDHWTAGVPGGLEGVSLRPYQGQVTIKPVTTIVETYAECMQWQAEEEQRNVDFGGSEDDDEFEEAEV